MIETYAQLLRLYVLVSPRDEGGNALAFEPAHIERLLMHTKEARASARRILRTLDEDYTGKNAGRSAAALVSTPVVRIEPC